MAKKLINNFNGGELSPYLYGRADFPKYNTGCITMENFIPLSYGGAIKRSGTRFITQTKDNNAARLIPFVVDVDNTYLLEFTRQTIRLFKNDTLVLNEDGDVLEIPTPYEFEELATLDFVQSLDVMFLAHTNHPLAELKRVSVNANSETWSYNEFEFLMPPLQTENTDSSFFLQLKHDTANHGGYYLESTGFEAFSLNTSDDDGQYYQLKEERINDTTRTTGGEAGWNANVFTSDISAESNNNNGWIVSGNTAISPWINLSFTNWNIEANCKNVTVTLEKLDMVSSSVAIFDRNTTTDWLTYRTVADNRGGNADVIKVFTLASTEPEEANSFIRVKVSKDSAFVTGDCTFSLSSDNANVISLFKLKEDDNASATERAVDIESPPQGIKGTSFDNWQSESVTTWSAGAFSFASGFPVSVAFYENRLVLGGTFLEPNTLWLSKTNELNNFTIGNLDTDALSLTLNSITNNEIKWLIPSSALVIGTTSSEWTLSSDSDQLPITPTSFSLKERSTFGTNDIKAQFIKDSILFLSLSSKKLREWNFNYFTLESETPDLTLLSEHITKTGIKEMSFQREPDSILWMIKNDGQLIGLTYDKEQKVYAWHKHKFGLSTSAFISFFSNFNQQLRIQNYTSSGEGDTQQKKRLQSINKDFEINTRFNLQSNQQIANLVLQSGNDFCSLKRSWNPILFCSSKNPEDANAVTLQVADDSRGVELQVAGRTQQGIHFRGQGDYIDAPNVSVASSFGNKVLFSIEFEAAFDHYRSSATAPDGNFFNDGTENPFVSNGIVMHFEVDNENMIRFDNSSPNHIDGRWQIRSDGQLFQSNNYNVASRTQAIKDSFTFEDTKKYNTYRVDFDATTFDATNSRWNGTYKFYLNGVEDSSREGHHKPGIYNDNKIGTNSSLAEHLSHFTGSLKNFKFTVLPGDASEDVKINMDFTSVTTNTVSNTGTMGNGTVNTVNSKNVNTLQYTTSTLPLGFQDYRNRDSLQYATTAGVSSITNGGNINRPFYAHYIPNLIDNTEHELTVEFLPSQHVVRITKDGENSTNIPYRWNADSRVRTEVVDGCIFGSLLAGTENYVYGGYDTYTPNGQLLSFELYNYPYISPNVNNSVTTAASAEFEPYMDITCKTAEFRNGKAFDAYIGGQPDHMNFTIFETTQNQKRIGSDFNTDEPSPCDMIPETTGDQGKPNFPGYFEQFYGYPTGVANGVNPNGMTQYAYRSSDGEQPYIEFLTGTADQFTINIDKLSTSPVAGMSINMFQSYNENAISWVNSQTSRRGNIPGTLKNITWNDGGSYFENVELAYSIGVGVDSANNNRPIAFIFIQFVNTLYNPPGGTFYYTAVDDRNEGIDNFTRPCAETASNDNISLAAPSKYLEYDLYELLNSDETFVRNIAGYMLKAHVFTDTNDGVGVPNIIKDRTALERQDFIDLATSNLRINSIASVPNKNNDDELFATIQLGNEHQVIKFDPREWGTNYKTDYNGLDCYNRTVISNSATPATLSGYSHLTASTDVGVMINGESALATINGVDIKSINHTTVGSNTVLTITPVSSIGSLTSGDGITLKGINIPSGAKNLNTTFQYSKTVNGVSVSGTPTSLNFTITSQTGYTYQIVSLASNGTVTIPQGVTAGDVVVVGLNFQSILAPMFIQSPELPGEKIAGFRGEVLFKDTVSAKVGQTEDSLSKVLFNKNNSADSQKSDVAEFYISNENKYLQTIFIKEDGNQPCTVLSSVLDIEV